MKPQDELSSHCRIFGRIAEVCILVLSVQALPGQRPEDRPLPPPPPVHAEFRFDFGPGKAPEGYTKVLSEDVYSSEKCYGFDFGSKPLDSAPGEPVGVERGGDPLDSARDRDPMTDGFVTTDEPPLFFSVKVPEGNYRITVTLGDARGESRTTIRAEAAHLMAANIVTAPGKFERRTFYANVRRPQLPPPPHNAPGGTEVHMFLAGEAESRCWDEKLTIEFNNTRPCLCAMEIVKDDAVPTVFVAGDSTVGDPRRGPGGNWPTQISQFLKPEVAVCNSAEGGETSKSFITGLRFDKVLSQMKAGDFFLVQFGHNDSKPQWPQSYTEPGTSFNAYLRVFIAETRRRGATPVLVTPMERRSNGDSVGPWARAMRDVAAQEKVPLIDQWAMSKELWTAMGTNVNQAFADQTHLTGYGGYLLSKLIVGGIRKNVPTLSRFVVDDFKEMDPAHPEPPPEYLHQPPGPGAPAGGARTTVEPADPLVGKAREAALSMQRKSWEQGVLALAFLEEGDDAMVVALAQASLIYTSKDGLAAALGGAPVDPLMLGEPLWRAAQIGNSPALRRAADDMLDWTLTRAPRAADGTIFHTGGTIWSDSFHTSPPFLACAGRYVEALQQIDGHRRRLWNPEKKLVAHIWDESQQRCSDPAFWGGGNGWTAAALARVIRALPQERGADRVKLAGFLRELIDGCLAHQCASGLFHNVVDDPASFEETNLAQMLAYAIYESVRGGWLPADYLPAADRMRTAARDKVDERGFVQGVAGAPAFDRPGVSPEGQAFFLMMEAAHRKLAAARRM